MFKDDARLTQTAGEGREIDRRTIAKGVAWTVPVVIVATAAPAAAASGAVTLDSASVRAYRWQRQGQDCGQGQS